MSGFIRDIVTLGIDEAGRGPVLGPMVMAAVALRPRKAASLTRAGVTDSKAFGAGADAHARRSELAARIESLAESIAFEVIDVDTIDRRVAVGQLNVLEREVAARLIGASCRADRILCDGARLFAPMCADYPQLQARDRAEEHHVAVAAASIIAKVRRDALFFAIAARYEPEFGPITGGGYENAGTRRFLDAYVATYGRLPPEARKTWGNAAAKLQLSLFGDGS